MLTLCMNVEFRHKAFLANSSYLYESKYGWGSDLGFLPYIQYLVLDAEKFHEYRSAPCDTIQKYVPVFISLPTQIGRFGTDELDNSLSPLKVRTETLN